MLVKKNLVPGEMWLAAFCMETGYTPAQIRRMPNWIVEDMRLIIQKEALVEQERMREKTHGTGR